MAAARKLDIFEALRAIDRHDLDWLDHKDEDAKKEFAPPVVLRWASAIEGNGQMAEYYLLSVNERANVHGDEVMSQYPDLFYRLIASCGIGSGQRHQWIAGAARKKSSSKTKAFFETQHPMASDQEIDLLISLHTPQSLTDLVRSAGLSPQDEAAILKEHGIKEKTKSKSRGAKVSL